MSTEARTQSPHLFAAPYVAGLIVQLPLLIGYYRDLGYRPHYGLYLVGLLATIAIAALWWPRRQSNVHRDTIGSSALLLGAIASGAVGAIFVQPWFAALSAILLIASYLAATTDQSGFNTLFYAALPLLAFLRPPLDWDLSITTRIQNYSTFLASRFITLISPVMGHKVTDSAYVVPGWEPFRFSDSLVGIASVFTLIFVALIYIAITRRTLFQSALLIFSCFVWSLVLNTTYLMLLPVLGIFLEYELSPGTSAFKFLRILLLLGTILMVVSTGRFLRFACDPVDPEVGRSYGFGRFITAVWNRLFASEPFISDTGQIVGRSPQPVTQRQPTMIVRWAAAIILAAAGVMPLIKSANIFGAESSRSTIKLIESDMPQTLDDWEVVEGDFEPEAFDGSNVLGTRRHIWKYQSPVMAATLSISQPFQMWHELTDFYRIKGWEVTSREKRLPPASIDGSAPQWSFIETKLKRNTGEKSLLLFAYCDAAGTPIDGPDSWGTINARVEAASLPHSGSMFQVSLFRSHFSELTEDKHTELTDLFLKLREAAKDRISKGDIAPPTDTDPATTPQP